MQHFAPQYNSNQQTTHSLRASQYRKVRKRRRGEVQDDSSSPEPEPRTGLITKPLSYASHASPEIAQLRVAGLVPEDEFEIPPSPFPHAPAKAIKEPYGRKEIQEEIAKSPTRLYAVNALSKTASLNKQSEATSLKKTHLNVLSTVMHRCLLDHDYARAGRAWGMLLRTQVTGGHPVDPRNHDRWGIGAEILLRGRPSNVSNDDARQLPDEEALSESMFSEEGFELAREYYERLIIQYPYRKLNPHGVDERTFYPAMFSLWIFEVCEKSKRARRRANEHVRRRRSRSMSINSVPGDRPDQSRTREDAIQVEELARAMEIAERLDQLVASPPFDKHASLLDLRGQVSMWTSVLVAGNFDDEDDSDLETTDQSLEENASSATEQVARLTNLQRELQQAQQFFQKAEANGAPRRTTALASIDIKLKELARRFAKFRATRED